MLIQISTHYKINITTRTMKSRVLFHPGTGGYVDVNSLTSQQPQLTESPILYPLEMTLPVLEHQLRGQLLQQNAPSQVLAQLSANLQQCALEEVTVTLTLTNVEAETIKQESKGKRKPRLINFKKAKNWKELANILQALQFAVPINSPQFEDLKDYLVNESETEK